MKNRLSLTLFSVSLLLSCAPAHSAEKAAKKLSGPTQNVDTNAEQFLADRVAYDALCSVRKGTHSTGDDMNKGYESTPARWYTETVIDSGVSECSHKRLYWVEEPLVSAVRTLVARRGLDATGEILQQAGILAGDRRPCSKDENHQVDDKCDKWCISEVLLFLFSQSLKKPISRRLKKPTLSITNQ